MSDLVMYRFQPDAMDKNVLRRLFVGRQDLLDAIRGD